MGWGGQLEIKNKTTHKFKRHKKDSHHMNHWEPPHTIDPKSKKKFYVEYDNSAFDNPARDKASVEYKSEDGNIKIKINVKVEQEPFVEFSLEKNNDNISIEPDGMEIFEHNGTNKLTIKGKL